jgi:hypothetical protein
MGRGRERRHNVQTQSQAAQGPTEALTQPQQLQGLQRLQTVQVLQALQVLPPAPQGVCPPHPHPCRPLSPCRNAHPL